MRSVNCSATGPGGPVLGRDEGGVVLAPAEQGPVVGPADVMGRLGVETRGPQGDQMGAAPELTEHA